MIDTRSGSHDPLLEAMELLKSAARSGRLDGRATSHVLSAVDQLHAARRTHPASPLPPRARPLVLVAEDQAELRQLIVRLLRRDYDVNAACDGIEALDSMAADPPDVAILDIMMPQRDGLAVVKQMRATPHLANIPVVMVTARAQPQDIVSGLESGADDYLTKPFRSDELRARVQAALRKHHTLVAEANARAAAESRVERNREVMHNVGNVLTSVGVSAGELRRLETESRLAGLARAGALLQAHETDLPAFFASDPRAKALPGYLSRVAEVLAAERGAQLQELADLLERVELMQRLLVRGSTDATADGAVDLARVANDALGICAGSFLRQGVTVQTDLPAVGEVAGDPDDLGQVVLNLLKNAREAMSDSGTRILSVRTERVDDGCALVVSDTGHGIDAERLTRVFERGESTKPHGSGIGLHFCARVVSDLGGAIAAHSEGPGMGATFRLVLPRAADARLRQEAR